MSHNLLSTISKNCYHCNQSSYKVPKNHMFGFWYSKFILVSVIHADVIVPARNLKFSNNEITYVPTIITLIQGHRLLAIFLDALFTQHSLWTIQKCKNPFWSVLFQRVRNIKKTFIYSIFKKEIMNIIRCQGVCLRVSFVKRARKRGLQLLQSFCSIDILKCNSEIIYIKMRRNNAV